MTGLLHRLLGSRTTPAAPPGATRRAKSDARPDTPDDRKWIGVDLDGTLARFEGRTGRAHIGPPVPAMLRRVRAWLEDGRRVKIFTARANDPAAEPFIRAWLVAAGLPADLEITSRKDFGMIELWDDRAVQVRINLGEAVAGSVSRL